MDTYRLGLFGDDEDAHPEIIFGTENVRDADLIVMGRDIVKDRFAGPQKDVAGAAISDLKAACDIYKTEESTGVMTHGPLHTPAVTSTVKTPGERALALLDSLSAHAVNISTDRVIAKAHALATLELAAAIRETRADDAGWGPHGTYCWWCGSSVVVTDVSRGGQKCGYCDRQWDPQRAGENGWKPVMG